MQPNKDEQELHNVLTRNIVFSLLANIFYLVTRLAVPPIILHYVTLGEYGLWSYCFIIISYLSMSAFGVSNVYVRYAAVYNAKGETEQINRLISTGLISVGGLCLILIPIFWFLLPWIIAQFNVSDELKPTAFYLLFGTILTFLFDLTLNVFSYILQSLQKFVIEKFIWTLSCILETILIIVFLVSGMGIYSLLFAYAVRIIVAAICYAISCYKALPKLSIGFSHFDRSLLKLFYHFGGIVQLSGMLSTINRGIEKVLAGLYIGPEGAGLFELGEKFPITVSNIPGVINAVLLPTSAHMHENEMHDPLKQLYLNSSRWVNVMTGLMMGFLMPFAVPLVIAWLGTDPKYSTAALILMCFSLPHQLNVLTGPGSAIYRGVNRPSRELVYPVLQLGLIFMAVLGGFMIYGYELNVIIFGVASMTIVSSLIYIVICNNYMRINQFEYLKKVLVPGLIPYLVGYLIYFFMRPLFHAHASNRLETFNLFLLGWVIYTSLLLPLTYFVIFSAEERLYFRHKFMKILWNNGNET